MKPSQPFDFHRLPRFERFPDDFEDLPASSSGFLLPSSFPTPGSFTGCPLRSFCKDVVNQFIHLISSRRIG